MKFGLEVKTEPSRQLFCKMKANIYGNENPDLFCSNSKNDLCLNIKVYGKEPFSIQTMWNAIDDFIISTTNYHSLFELYGHFTEPHPIFQSYRIQTM